MSSSLYVYTGFDIYRGDAIGLASEESVVLVYKMPSGMLSFSSDDFGRILESELMSSFFRIGSRGGQSSWSSATGYAIWFYNADAEFFKELDKVEPYRVKLSKKPLYERYGKEFFEGERPVLDFLKNEVDITKEVFQWLYDHCGAFCLWQCVVGSQAQPVFYGKESGSFVNIAVKLGAENGVSVHYVKSQKELPNW